MIKFNKKPRADKGPKNKLAIRYGTYTTIICIVAALLMIGVNFLATLASDRFPIDIDITAEKGNTITKENLEIIKNINNEVSITVCATEEGYVGEMLNYYASNIYNAADETVGTKFYQQTVNLVKEYEKYNTKIDVNFVDLQDPSFSQITAKYPQHEFIYGDILVESPAFNSDGTPRLNESGVQATNNKFIEFTDIYTLSDESGYASMGYGSYTVSGNELETELTSAIYGVTSTETVSIGFVTSHSDESVYAALRKKLELNNYVSSEISDPVITKIPEELDVIVIAAPTSDFSADEIEAISKYLDNGGKKGKGMLYFASTTSPALPNLYSFLKEWGVNYDTSKIVFETDANNYIESPSVIGVAATDNDYTKALEKSKFIYISSDNIAMSPAYEYSGKRTAVEVMKTSDTTVCVPVGAYASYDTSKEKKSASSVAIVTKELVEDEDYNDYTSYVACFSSVDIISSYWAEYSSVGNMDMTIAVTNKICNRDANDIYFSPKEVTNESFIDKISAAGVTTVKIIVLGIIPLAIIVIAVIVIVRRRSR